MKASHFSRDPQEFMKLLSEHRVKYVIVGGEAVIYYAEDLKFLRKVADAELE
jgi:hypothetical protein